MEFSSGSIRVLCVDDDAALVDLTSRFLERAHDGLTVVTETDAESGLERLETESVDCIVSDYDMPGMDGLAFLEVVRETDSDLPFILFTGKGSEEIASEAISVGVTDYLQKKLGADQYVVLANRIENAVESYRTQRALERNELLFEAVFDDPAAFITVTEPDGTIVDVNRTILEFVEGSAEELEGKHIWESSWWDRNSASRDQCRGWIERAADGEYVEFEVEYTDGDRAIIDGTIRPVRAGGTVVALIAEGRNVRDRRLWKRQLETCLTHFAEVEHLAENGVEEPLASATADLSSASDACSCGAADDYFDTITRAHGEIDESARVLQATAAQAVRRLE
ncbi:response regulator [Natronobiforma cellulositropha]|uniref:response regulator n=1 Tax=Natronobiforma cellulositropha TaxID=1679076 RepID=UPI0021D5CFD2|nr:response regulator [Natronobiforma cellulositropha]